MRRCPRFLGASPQTLVSLTQRATVLESEKHALAGLVQQLQVAAGRLGSTRLLL